MPSTTCHRNHLNPDGSVWIGRVGQFELIVWTILNTTLYNVEKNLFQNNNPPQTKPEMAIHSSLQTELGLQSQ